MVCIIQAVSAVPAQPEDAATQRTLMTTISRQQVRCRTVAHWSCPLLYDHVCGAPLMHSCKLEAHLIGAIYGVLCGHCR